MRNLACRRILVMLIVALLVGAWTPRRGGRGGFFSLGGLIDPDRVLIVIVDGQSNARGSGGVPVVSTTPSATDFGMCADDVTIQALDENDLACMVLTSGVGGHSYTTEPFATTQETPLTGVVYALRQHLPDHAPAIIGIRCGFGGQVIANWDPDRVSNPTWYSDCIDRVQAVATAVAADPATYGTISGRVQVLGTARWQGEADSIVGTTQATYRDALIEIADRAAVDIMTITGQAHPPVLITEVPTSYGSDTPPKDEPPPAVLGHIEACETSSLVFCTGPNYPFDSGDNYHKDPEAHRQAGEVAGEALWRAIHGEAVRPLKLASAVTSGDALTVCFDVPVGNLQIDTSVSSYAIGQGTSSTYGCPAHPGGNYGLEVYDTTGTPPTLSNVTLVGDGRCVQAKLSRALDEADSPTVRVAWTVGHSGSPLSRFACQDTTAVGFANFTDSDTVPRWAMPSEVAVAEVADAGVGVDSGVVPDSGPQYATRFGDDSVDEYLQAPDEATWTPTGPITVCAHAWLSTTSPTNRAFASWGTYSTDWSWVFETGSCSGAVCPLQFWTALAAPDASGCRATGTSATAITAGGWHTVCAVSNPSTDVTTFYLDGSGTSEVGTNSGSCGIASAFRNSAGLMRVGQWAGLTRYWRGYLRTVTVWDEALDTTEIDCVHDTAPSGSVAGCADTTPLVDFTGSDTAHTTWAAVNAGSGGDFSGVNLEQADFCSNYPGNDAGACAEPTVYAAVLGGPSYFHSGGGTAQTAVWTDAGTNDAGFLLAYQALDGSVIAAVDNSVGAAASIGAIQVAASSEGRPFILVDWQQPQTPPWSADLAAWQTNLTAAAEWARSRGYKLCPVGHWDLTGGYYVASNSLPFLDGGTAYSPDAGSYLEIMQSINGTLSAHLATMTDGGGVDPNCATLVLYDLKGPYSGTPSTALVQAPYSADFYDYTTTSPLLDTSGWFVQSDGLHFTRDGHKQAADGLARTWVRAANDTTASRFVPTTATVVDGETVDITFTVPCRTHGDCATDPPLVVDTAGRVAQETQGGVATYGLHFWFGGSLVAPPNPVASATPQACTSPATSCTVRYVFTGGLPSFDEISFGDVYCKNNGDADCSFGPAAAYAGGSNIVSPVNSACKTLPDGGTYCYEQPGYNRLAATYDAGVPVDAGFAASNLYYMTGSSTAYASVTGTGGGTSACVSAWADAPALASNAHIVGPTTNLRLDMREISSSIVCAATNTPGVTYRTFATTPTAGTRHHWACCFDPTLGLHVWLDGAADDGSLTGSGTALQADGTFRWPQLASGNLDVDEVMFFPNKTTFTPATDLLQVRCATKASTDSSPTSGECSGVTTDVSTVCSDFSGLRWYGLEQNATDRCGVLAGSETGSPSYTAY